MRQAGGFKTPQAAAGPGRGPRGAGSDIRWSLRLKKNLLLWSLGVGMTAAFEAWLRESWPEGVREPVRVTVRDWVEAWDRAWAGQPDPFQSQSLMVFLLGHQRDRERHRRRQDIVHTVLDD